MMPSPAPPSRPPRPPRAPHAATAPCMLPSESTPSRPPPAPPAPGPRGLASWWRWRWRRQVQQQESPTGLMQPAVAPQRRCCGWRVRGCDRHRHAAPVAWVGGRRRWWGTRGPPIPIGAGWASVRRPFSPCPALRRRLAQACAQSASAAWWHRRPSCPLSATPRAGAWVDPWGPQPHHRMGALPRQFGSASQRLSLLPARHSAALALALLPGPALAESRPPPGAAPPSPTILAQRRRA
mmetsp:Transcript_10203/g.32284  ORF Transcript_10203/g.32284 Transcript_10203/m.32284 type:complete len:238 (-) Transcript_10203:990-1703(-)